MRRSNNFSLFIIADVPYLLPFGQGIADLRRGVQINDSGAVLWDLLDRERTEDEILSLYAAHYEASDSQLPQLQADLRQFLHMLDRYGMLERSNDQVASNIASSSAGRANVQANAKAFSGRDYAGGSNDAGRSNIVERCLSIGGLILLLRGPGEAFSRDFDAFEIFPRSGAVRTDTAGSPPSRADRNSSMTYNTLHTDRSAATGAAPHIDQTVLVENHVPAPSPGNKVLLENHELTVMENDLQYTFLFPNAPGIYEAHLTKDGASACYYCCPPYTESFRQDLFHAIRLSFLYLAQLHDMIVLHSASLLYQGRAWLFSGHSGAGKSTHVNLWKELYGIPLLNGDLNLLSMENGCPVIHGLPWCGTSGIADTCSYPLGGILFVKQSSQNRVSAADESHAQLLVVQRLISPNWTEALMRKNLRLVAELAPHILIRRLCCTKTPEAALTAKQAIDDYLASLLTDDLNSVESR